jgi:hypothetical protein
MRTSRNRLWKDWFCFFVEQEQELAKKYPEWIDMTEPGDAADRFADLEAATKSEVERCIEEFSSNGGWPQMSPSAGAMLRVRIVSASDHATVLCEGRGHFPPSWSRQRQLEWFLIHLWEHAGFGELVGSYENLRRDGDTGKLPILSHN